MQSSSIYKFIEVYLASAEQKQYQAMTTADGRKYYLYTLPPSGIAHLSIDNNQYRIMDEHISIDAEYDDDQPGYEAYHRTICVMLGRTEFIVHCFYKLNGNATGVTMRQGDTFIELSAAAKKQLQDYAQPTVAVIQNFNLLHMQKKSELQATIANKDQRASELSDNPKNLKSYIGALRDLIKTVRKFNYIANNTMTSELDLLRQILAVCKRKAAAIKVALEEKSNREHKKATGPSVLEKAAPSLGVSEEKKSEMSALESINVQLSKLEGTDLSTLQERQKLLNIKLTLIPDADLNNILATRQALYRLRNQIIKITFELALRGDVEAAKAILANNYVIELKFYFYLIHHEQEKVFDLLFGAFPVANFLIDQQATLPDLYSHPIDMLTIAYTKKNESLCRKLLFTYHRDPNLTDFFGRQLLHDMAEAGDIHYAQMMLAAGADVNIMAGNISGGTLWTLQLTAPLSAHEKKQVIKDFKQKAAIQKKVQAPKTTPLMAAVIHSKDKMVKYLIKQKADVNVRAEVGLDAIGIHAAGKGYPLHAPTLLELLEAGASIDSINSVSSLSQANPLHYRCQWLDEVGVKLLVNQFAADPNILVRKERPDKKDAAILLDCLTAVAAKTLYSDTQKEATSILFFLLHQDIRPLGAHSLSSSLDALQVQSRTPIYTILPEELSKQEYKAHVALSKHEHEDYCLTYDKIISSCSSGIGRAILTNLKKLRIIQAAEKDLANKDFQHCIDACQTILRAKFSIDQYNERLWAVYYKAYLGLGDDENACKALEHYLRILTQKSVQVLSPKYKAEVNNKIAIASTQLAEIHERLVLLVRQPVRVMHPAHLFHFKPAREMAEHELSHAPEGPR